MSTEQQPSVPVAHSAPSKLQLENQSLKRRLVQYAATLEKLTTHAKREIDQSTRARDEALSRAADASALRQKITTMNASLTSAQSARDTATASLHRAEARVEQLQATLASLQRRLDDARYDDTHVASMREELLSLRKELPNLRRLREQDASRALTLNEQLEVEKQKSATYDSMVLRLQQLQTENSQLATDRDASQMSLTNLRRSESSATRERDDVIVKLRESQDMNDMLRQQLDQLQDRVRLLDHRLKDAEANEIRHEKEAAEAKKQADDAVSALRTELDSALKDLGDRNTMYDELKVKHDRSIDAESALAERDSMRSNIRQLQVELDQSTEMLTRAAIDALADKGKIRKCEDAISKLRGELEGDRKEKSLFETRTVNLTQQIAALEGELDQVRNSKRELADECHKYQLQIHERDSVVASKNRALEELDTDRNDRAFQIDRLRLELSNSKNALAKKESDLVKLTTEYEDMCSVLKSTNRDLDDKHSEVSSARREVTAANDQISKLTQERDHLKVTVAELQVASRQVEELNALVSAKDDELGSMKRWCTTLKAEAGESVREKKRLSDMLSDVSGDLKRANQELELLRNMRQEQEVLAQRISQIGETSSRELSDMRKSQSEQAEVLAKSTVEAYQGQLVEIQKSAHHEIAETVSTQLRDDIMPHLMKAVDAKARNLVHALAKHVESFTLDDATSYDYAKDQSRPVPSTKVEVGTAASVERSVGYASSAAASRSVSVSAQAYVPQSGSRSAVPLSATESPSISMANASQGDYTGVESTAEPSAITSDRSVEVSRGYAEPSSVPTAASSAQGVPSETVEFQSEDVDITDDIDPVAIHNRLTETYKQLLGGRADLDLGEFQTASEVIEQNVVSRQVMSVSAEPVAQEQSEKVAEEGPVTTEVSVGTRDIPSMAMEQLDAPQPTEEELEIVESYVPKEGEVDESFEDGEEETEEDAPEEEDLETTNEPAHDPAEEFKDALADVVPLATSGDADAQVAEDVVHELPKEVDEPGLVEEAQELPRGFPVEPEPAEPVEKEVEAETLAQIESEKGLPHTPEVEVPPAESAPLAGVATAAEEAPGPEESVEVEVAAPSATADENIQDVAHEPVEEIHDVAPLAEAEVEGEDETRAPADLEEELEGEGLVGADQDIQVTAPVPVEPKAVDTGDAIADVKQDLEEVAADEDVPQESEEPKEVFQDASREIEVAVADTAEVVKGDQEEAEEAAADEDGPQEGEEVKEVFHAAPEEVEVAVADAADEAKQDPEGAPADSGLQQEHEEPEPEEVVHDVSREIEVAVADAADAEKGDQEEVAADADVPQEDVEAKEVFHDAPEEIAVAVADAADEAKQDPEGAPADSGLQLEHEEPEPEEVVHDVSREIEVAVADAADAEKGDQEEVAADADVPQEGEEAEVFHDASEDIEVAVADPADEAKQDPEGAPADSGLQQEHQEPEPEEVVHDVSREIEVAVADAADAEKGDQEEAVADEDVPQEVEEAKEVFHAAAGEIEAAVETAPREVEEAVAVEEEEVKPLEEVTSGEDKHPPEESDDQDQHLIEEAGNREPREAVTVADAAEHDDDGDVEQEPMEEELETHDVAQVVEGNDTEVVPNVSPAPEHESVLQPQAEDIAKVSASSPADAVERAVIDNILIGDEQPQHLDLSADPEQISEDVSMRTETEEPTISDKVVQPTAAVESVMEAREEEVGVQAEVQEDPSETIEQRTPDFAPLESQPAEAILEGHQDTGVDLSSGLDEAVLAADKIVLSATGEEVVEATTTLMQPDVPSHGVDEDFVIGGGGEGDPQKDIVDPVDGNVQESSHASFAEEATNEMEQASKTPVAHADVGVLGEEDHGPSTEHVDEIAAVGSESAQGLEGNEGEEDIEEVDATREDYDVDVELETEPPVMAFATLNVVEEDDIIEDDEDDDIEDDEDDEIEEEGGVVQDAIEELDLTGGVPADLDAHSDLEEYEDVVNEDDMYGHAVIEELPEDVQLEEEISATAEHEADGMKGEEEVEVIPTEQERFEDAKDTMATTREGADDALPAERGTSGTGETLAEVTEEEGKEKFNADFIRIAKEMEAERAAAAASTGDAVTSLAAGGDGEAKVDDSVEGENILRA